MTTRSEIAFQAAQVGATTAEEFFQTDVAVETKASKMDFVSDADTTAQQRVIEVIHTEYPDATIVGEEEGELKSVPTDGNAWVIDPIDGTTNFIHEVPLWTTSVAVVRGGKTTAGVSIAPALGHGYTADETGVSRDDEPVSVSEKTGLDRFCVAPILRYGPDRDEEFGSLLSDLIVEFGDLRRLGCAQITLAMVATGSLDAAVSAQPNPNPWDTLAGVYMVEQAGGVVTDIYGDPWTPASQGLVATNGKRHKAVIDVVASVA